MLQLHYTVSICMFKTCCTTNVRIDSPKSGFLSLYKPVVTIPRTLLARATLLARESGLYGLNMLKTRLPLTDRK